MTRTCLVTGGTRGIGFAIAAALLRQGAHVAISGRSEEALRPAIQALADGGNGDRIAGFACEMRDAAAVESMMRRSVSKFGGLDVLVNNAGVGIGAPVADLSDEEWDRIVGTNLTGVFYCCRAAIPHLRAHGGGWIINVSSLASQNPFAGGAAYCASKAGLNAFSEALMQELRYDGIRVSCVLPGSVATGFSGRETSAGADWKLHPEDVAQVVIDLLDHPSRSLPSKVEIRPSRPPRK